MVHSLLIETPRLRLRPFRPEAEADQRFIIALVNDPAWVANIGKRDVSTREQAEAFLRNGPVAMVERLGFGLLMVESAADGTLLGMCGLIKRDTLPDVDIGFAFLPPYRAQGYAREAAEAVLGWARRLGLGRVVAIVTPTNMASIGLLRRLGFGHEGSILQNDETLLLMGWSAGAG
ncbi:MAG: GNAT family N-acetyltransferase [Pseudomonadota bacterium]